MKAILDSVKLRQVAGAFATGVAVVTVAKPDGEVHGMTANSFLSVSLDPPLVLFSVQNDASLLEFLQQDTSVGISILSETQEDISRHFAGDTEVEFDEDFRAHVDVHLIKDCLAWYRTQIAEMIPAGDHTLILCRILECDRREGNPLLYYSGYRFMAEKSASQG